MDKNILIDFFNCTLKEVHIDIFIDSPFALLGRNILKKVNCIVNKERFVIKQSDRNKTVAVNIPMNIIEKCITKSSENYQEFILTVHNNINYKITVIF